MVWDIGPRMQTPAKLTTVTKMLYLVVTIDSALVTWSLLAPVEHQLLVRVIKIAMVSSEMGAIHVKE